MRVEISPRLLPAVRIAESFVSVEPTDRRDADGKPVWKWFVDAPGFSEEGSDLRGWGNAGEMLETLLSFLSACAESYMPNGENCDLFPPRVAEWAYLHSTEIDCATLPDDSDA